MATIAGLFESYENADRALHELEHLGFCSSNFGVILPGNSACNFIENRVDKKDSAAMPAITGAVLGGLTGLLAGVAPLVIPEIGPIISAGALTMTAASTAAGAGFGALSGGILGVLVNLGIPELNAKIQLEGIKKGEVLLTVRADAELLDQVSEVLLRNNVVDIETRRSIWERQDTKENRLPAD